MPSNQQSFITICQFIAPKILFAIVCGGLIGLERELKNKAAGLKTNMLICVGAALYTALSMMMSSTYVERGYFGDPSRISAQIVSGIGFLGGGAIIQSRGTITGLTTAATIWVVAAIGVLVGIGYPFVAVVASLAVVLTLVATTFLERLVLEGGKTFTCVVLMEDHKAEARKNLHEWLEENDLAILHFELRQREGLSHVELTYRGNETGHKKFILKLWSLPGVREVNPSV